MAVVTHHRGHRGTQRREQEESGCSASVFLCALCGESASKVYQPQPVITAAPPYFPCCSSPAVPRPTGYARKSPPAVSGQKRRRLHDRRREQIVNRISYPPLSAH